MAGTDLAQYNGTPSFPARTDVGTNTDPYLTVTDGPVVTADSNAAGFAPVNISIKRVKDLLLGLRGAIVGDFAGAVQKSVKSFYADLTGGATHTKPAGSIFAYNSLVAETGDVVASAGAVEATAGPLRAGTAAGERAFLTMPGITFEDVSGLAAGANPPKTEPIPNQYRAVNSTKFWFSFETDGAGGITELDGAGGCTLSIAGGKVVVSFPLPNFDNTHYGVYGNGGSAGAAAAFHADPADKAVGSCKFKIGSFDPAATAVYGQVMILGRQTT